MLGVAVDAIETIIKLASLMLKRDFWEEGRTMERLGLAGRSVQEIKKLAIEGEF
jgi:opine dehydrogenase